jgi:hypothetical protein
LKTLRATTPLGMKNLTGSRRGNVLWAFKFSFDDFISRK